MAIYKLSVFKLLNSFTLWHKKHVEPEGIEYQIPEQFFGLNKKFWPEIPDYNSFFLIDFLIKDSLYYNVHFITARALVEILKAQPVALLSSRADKNLTKLAESYGFKNILYLEDFNSAMPKRLKLWLAFYSVVLWISNRSKQRL